MPAKKKSPFKRSRPKQANSSRKKNYSYKTQPALTDATGIISANEMSARVNVGRRTKKIALGVNHALFLSASICAIATTAPQIAVAQTLPTGCSDAAPGGNGNGAAEATETITCISATEITSGISTTVDDITIVVGSADQATAVSNSSGTGVYIYGFDDQSLYVYNAGSSITGSTKGVEIAGAGITVDIEGAVEGSTYGIDAYIQNELNSFASITTADVTATASTGIGIQLYNAGYTANHEIDTTAGTVYGGDTGIYVKHAITGNGGYHSITTADVAGKSGYGIKVKAGAPATNIILDTTAGTVYGGVDGIDVDHDGSGYVDITTADVTGKTGYGIDVSSDDSTTNVTIDTTAGYVYGFTTAIKVDHDGSGYVDIKTADVTGYNNHGIEVYAASTVSSVTIDTTASNAAGSNVYGYYAGIDVTHYGSGYLSITTGDVFARKKDGIHLYSGFNYNANVTINTTDGSVRGYDDGIYVKTYNEGGDLLITTADVEGDHGYGIRTYIGSGNDIDTIIDTSAGKVIGGIDGIRVFHGDGGTGYISITTADVTGKADDGINIYAGDAITDVTIDTTAGYVYGKDTGIEVDHYGSGYLSIKTADVTGYTGDGIYLFAGNINADAIINTTAGSVDGEDYGIHVQAYNSGGDISITTADVEGRSGSGIRVYNSGYDINEIINTTAGRVIGGTYGIYLEHANSGAGYISITTADVTGKTEDGIFVKAGNEVTDITIDTTAGYVYGRKTGIDVSHAGTGFLSITTADVTGKSGYGIYVDAGNAVTDVTIDTSEGYVYGKKNAINVSHQGTGALSITTASVWGHNFDGIDVTTGSNVTGVTINTTASNNTGGEVYGYYYGIQVDHNGSGNVSITTADVTGDQKNGIDVDADVNVADVTIDTAAGYVYGSITGIDVSHAGTGFLSITTADVTGTSGNGMEVYGGSSTTNMTIDSSAGAVFGGADGINAVHNGSGYISIKTADVTGNTGYGIFVDAASSVTGVTIDSTAGAVTGGTYGIEVEAGNSGIVSVTTADVTGKTENGIWIDAAATVSDIMIDTSAGNVYGYDRGMTVLHLGSGSFSLTTADVTGKTYDAINIFTQTTTTDATINTVQGSVHGQDAGMTLNFHGDGNVSVTTADVTGNEDDGIFVQTVSYVSGLSINSAAGAVYGGDNGIDANHNSSGGGDLEITTADVTGKTGYGIDTETDSASSDVTINTALGSVYGGTGGIRAIHNGSGALSITTADVTGGSGAGVYALSAANVSGVTINTAAGAVEGATSGIIIQHTGSGDIAVMAADVTGNNGVGIHAFHLGGGAVSFNLSGAVYGSDYGIRTYGPGGVSMTLASGASVSSGADAISIFGISNDVLTMEAGSSISGGAFLNDGDDTLNVNGGVFTGIFGGAGTDTANFGATGDDENTLEIASDALQEFEIFNFNAGGYELTGDHTGLTETNFYAGVNVLDGSLTSTDVMIADGATLNARDGAVITGLLSNYGTLDVGSSPGALTVIGDLFLGDTSYLPIEFTATAYDQIIVSGDVELGGTIELIVLDGASLGTTELTVITAEGEITGAVDITTSGLLLASDASIDDAGTGLTVTTTVGLPSQVVPGLTTNQQEIGDHIMLALTGDVTSQDFLLFINGVGSITDEETLAAVLDDLAPESLDIGLKMITESQGQFADLTLDMASRAAAAEDGKPRFWGAVDVFGVNQADSADYLGFDGHVTLYALGVSGVELGPVKLGAGLGFSNFTAGEDAGYGGVVRGDSATGRAVHLNANLHADIPSDLAFGLVGSIDSSFSWSKGENDLEMYTIDPASGAVVTQWTEADISSIDWRTRFSVDGFGNATLPVTPYAVVGLTNYDQEALTIGGSTIVPIEVGGLENLRGLASVGVEYEHWLKKNLRISADLSGTQYFGETQNEFSSRFVGAPDDQDSFLTFGKRVETQVAIKAGVEYHLNSGLMFSAVVGAETGDIEMIGGSLRMSKRF